ncbi:hypothetical protein [Novosphingobium colocasiae]|uniref:hypothetical protein n=1 Tax=Novosphingobium colocasiae TaxID=1256513 RepID=UPI0035B4A1F6
MSGGLSGRGQPLVALLTLLVGWAGGRAMGWEEVPPSGATSAVAAEMSVPAARAPAAEGGGAYLIDTRIGPQSYADVAPGPVAYDPVAAMPNRAALAGCGACSAYAPRHAGMQPLVVWDSSGYGWSLGSGRHDDRRAALTTPESRDSGVLPGLDGTQWAGPEGSPVPQAMAGPDRPAKPSRWSADSWAFLRKGTVSYLAPGVSAATYGTSQAGAIIRFRLDRSGRRPTAYLRTTSTLGALPESAAALGVSARPLARVPVYVALEGRLTQQRGLSRTQAAAMAVTELPPFKLPLGLRGEAYAQGGYVGGSFATPFADGQLRVDHGLFSLGPVDARAGAGVWGGIQKGASRLDTGPGLTLAFPLKGRTYGRLALDWRQRVAGNAQPGNGAALTLSAGF